MKAKRAEEAAAATVDDGVHVKKAAPVDPAVIAARRKLAEDFYRKSGMPPARIEGHLDGIGFTKPVDIVKVDKGALLGQYPNQPGVQGNYYFPLSNGSLPSSLGISSADARVKKSLYYKG